MNARVTESSQVHRLREELALEGVSHGAKVVAAIPNVMVSAGTIFFCNIPQVAVAKMLTDGDGSMLPRNAKLVGKNHFREDGYYNLPKVEITVNGSIEVKIVEEPQLVRAW